MWLINCSKITFETSFKMFKVLILIASNQFCTGFSASILGFNFVSPEKVIKNRIEQIPQFLERIPHIEPYKQDFTAGFFNPDLFANDGGVNQFNVFRNTYNPNSNKNSQAHSSGPEQSDFFNKIAPPATTYNNPSFNHGVESQESFDISNDHVTPFQYVTVSTTDGIEENVSNSEDESTFETTTSDYEWSTTDEPLNRIGGAPQAVLTSLLG